MTLRRTRQSVATFATEQAIREIYLKGFQYAVEEGGANAAMTSFNRIGTRWAGAHSGLCSEVLRKEWGFVGVTLTDAVMANRNWMDVSIGLEAGNDTWLSSGDWLVSKIRRLGGGRRQAAEQPPHFGEELPLYATRTLPL